MKTWADMLKATDAATFDWAARQPWSEPMRRCMQDAEWHAEGDVWTHTGMVFDHVTLLTEYPTLSRGEQIILLFVALLHDAGKPATTMVDPETGQRVRRSIRSSARRWLGKFCAISAAICPRGSTS